MTLSTALYMVDVLHQLEETLSFIGISGIILLIVAAVGKIICMGKYIDDDGDYGRAWDKVLKIWPTVVFFAVFSCFFPQKHTMYMMLGASYLKDSNLPSKVSQALELKLDDYIHELSDKNKENK